MRLLIPARVRDMLSAYAAAAAPAAVCGLLLGQGGAGEIRVSRALPCPNTAAAGDRAHRFEIDLGGVVNVSRSLSGTAEQIVGFFHSRPYGGAEWESSDRAALALWPETVWMVVAPAKRPQPVLRAWWRGGHGAPRGVEMEIEIVAPSRARSLCPD